MSRIGYVLFAVILFACGGRGKEDNACPSGTQNRLDSVAEPQKRSCIRADGTLHGPVVMLDGQGRERRIGEWVEGKMHGTWRLYVRDYLFEETTYDNGRIVSRITLEKDGTVLHENHWFDGLAHGRFIDRAHDPLSYIQGQFTHGRRSGTWQRSGHQKETWTYGDDGVLVTLDGVSVPLPPEAIVLSDGVTLRRSSCGLVRDYQGNRDVRSACFDLFEAFQRCAVTPEDRPCTNRALENYAKGTTR